MTTVFALKMRYHDKKLNHIKTEEHYQVFNSKESLENYFSENNFVLYYAKYNEWRKDLGDQGEVIAQVIEKSLI